MVAKGESTTVNDPALTGTARSLLSEAGFGLAPPISSCVSDHFGFYGCVALSLTERGAIARLPLNHSVLIRIQVRQPPLGPILWGFTFWAPNLDPPGLPIGPYGIMVNTMGEFAEDMSKSVGPHVTSVGTTNTGPDQNNAISLTPEIGTEAAHPD